MKLTVEIEYCIDCRHKGHSGGFTKGGAKPVCSHDEAPETFTASIPDRHKNITLIGHDNSETSATRLKDKYFHWKYRLINLDRVPPQACPLRHGHKY